MFKKITTTVFAVLVSLSLGVWLGYVSHTKANADEKSKTVAGAKGQSMEASVVAPAEQAPEPSVSGEGGAPKWSPKPLPAGDSLSTPASVAPSGLVSVRPLPSHTSAAEDSVFKQLDAGLLVAYQLKSVASAACLPYAQRVAVALEFNASVDSPAAYRARIHEAVQSGYAIGCFVKQEPAGQGALPVGASQATSDDTDALACQTYLDAVVNRIRNSRLEENEKQQHLADLYAYAAKSRCAP